jgi:hypothetical protein
LNSAVVQTEDLELDFFSSFNVNAEGLDFKVFMLKQMDALLKHIPSRNSGTVTPSELNSLITETKR